MKWSLVLLALCIIGAAACPDSFAQTKLKGQVLDQAGNPIADVNIQSPGIEKMTRTDSAGLFAVVLRKPGPIILTISHAKYAPKSLKVTPSDSTLIVTMIEQVYPMQGITVTAGRAVEGKSPVSFQNLNQSTIAKDYDIGEVPELLESTPNLYAYSDAGGGLGYSYLSIRGFDSRRVPVYINSIPLNDPEDHALYFVDLPDFAGNADNIQVQRGVGSSLYGDPAFGGSVNILTSPFSHDREYVGQFGYGQFTSGGKNVGLMRKVSSSYTTGLLDNGWSLSGKWVSQYSDGYRENSWYDGSAYYLSIGKVDPRMITTLNVSAGPMRTHAAWWGVTRDEAYLDRRLNYYTYPNETDNFNQPHFELHNIYSLNDFAKLYSTIYLIKGKGYYEELQSGQSLYDYNLSASRADTSDLVRRKWVNKYQLGLNSHLLWSTAHHSAALGGSYYHFESDHWGEVLWAQTLTPSYLDVNAPFRYYEHFGKYDDASVYGSYSWQPGQRLTLSGNLQLCYLKINVHRPAFGIYDAQIFGIDWLFAAPHIGINYAVTDNLNSYFSFSVSSHEPNDKMIVDSDDPADKPRLQILDSTASGIHYGNPTVNPERVYDFELGTNYRTRDASFGVNLFWMEYLNEIVPDGGLSDDGFPTYGNADRSVHRGIELTGAYNFNRTLRVEGNYAFNDNWNRKYVQKVYDYNSETTTTVEHRNVPVPNFPQYLANFVIDYHPAQFDVRYRLRMAGRQFPYLSGQNYYFNGQMQDVSVAPAAISSLKASVTLGKVFGSALLTLETRVDNLFNQKYETSAAYYADSYGEGYYYWYAAERNWYANVKLAIM